MINTDDVLMSMQRRIERPFEEEISVVACLSMGLIGRRNVEDGDSGLRQESVVVERAQVMTVKRTKLIKRGEDGDSGLRQESVVVEGDQVMTVRRAKLVKRGEDGR